MKKTILFGACIAFLWACGGTPEKKAESTSSTTAADSEVASEGPDGEKIYKQYCVVCHGIAGDMGASGAFNLTTSELTVEERMTVIANGRNTMTAFSALLDEEKIKAVAEYTLKLKAD